MEKSEIIKDLIKRQKRIKLESEIREDIRWGLYGN